MIGKIFVTIIIILCVLSFSVMIVRDINQRIYTEHVYDCSNMCIDQATFFEAFGLDVNVAVNNTHRHAWLLINTPAGTINWESTTMRFAKHDFSPDKIYDNIWLNEHNADFKSGPQILGDKIGENRRILRSSRWWRWISLSELVSKS